MRSSGQTLAYVRSYTGLVLCYFPLGDVTPGYLRESSTFLEFRVTNTLIMAFFGSFLLYFVFCLSVNLFRPFPSPLVRLVCCYLQSVTHRPYFPFRFHLLFHLFSPASDFSVPVCRQLSSFFYPHCFFHYISFARPVSRRRSSLSVLQLSLCVVLLSSRIFPLDLLSFSIFSLPFCNVTCLTIYTSFTHLTLVLLTCSLLGI